MKDDNNIIPCALRGLIGPLLVRAMLTAGWVALAVYAWNDHPTALWATATALLGIVLAMLWVQLFRQFFSCSAQRWKLEDDVLLHYRWHRCDQLQLLQVRDIYITWTWLGSLFNVGTVVLRSHEEEEPNVFLEVRDPEGVRDRIWRRIESVRHREHVIATTDVPS